MLVNREFLVVPNSNLVCVSQTLPDDEKLIKEDKTEVTVADLAVQVAMCEILNSHSESHGVKVIAEEDFSQLV